MGKLDEYINALKLSYAKVGNDTGYTRSYIRMLALGEKKNPTRETMEKINEAICKAYDDYKKTRKIKLPRPTIDILFYQNRTGCKERS